MSGQVPNCFNCAAAAILQDASYLRGLSRSHLDDYFAAAVKMRINFRCYPPIEVQPVLASAQRDLRFIARNFGLQATHLVIAHVRWVGDYQIEFRMRTG